MNGSSTLEREHSERAFWVPHGREVASLTLKCG